MINDHQKRRFPPESEEHSLQGNIQRLSSPQRLFLSYEPQRSF
uniref:Uncharacterized protein n=1 Tax=Brassica oleracea TaxID=3712 RepID=A0A3P6EX09_BRAOL|nr:unnamed protein product [Brassica oleracea]